MESTREDDVKIVEDNVEIVVDTSIKEEHLNITWFERSEECCVGVFQIQGHQASLMCIALSALLTRRIQWLYTVDWRD